jgi:hypothetical protein
MSVSREALPTSDGAQAARALLLLPVKALQTERGRRLVAALGLGLALQGMVGFMFANADAPPGTVQAAAVQPLAAGAAAQGPARAGVQPAAKAGQAVGDHAKPQDAAVAWFARQAGVPLNKVKALQQRPAGSGKVKVVVMAEDGERVDTDEVTVTRTGTGWRVR